MKKTVTICVTKGDIASGIRSNDEECPVAIAARRRLKMPVHVTCNRLIFDLPKTGQFANDLPENVRDAIERYDDGKGMKPFRFRMEVVTEK